MYIAQCTIKKIKCLCRKMPGISIYVEVNVLFQLYFCFVVFFLSFNFDISKQHRNFVSSMKVFFFFFSIFCFVETYFHDFFRKHFFYFFLLTNTLTPKTSYQVSSQPFPEVKLEILFPRFQFGIAN